jgi:hypothetical protein
MHRREQQQLMTIAGVEKIDCHRLGDTWFIDFAGIGVLLEISAVALHQFFVG